MRDKSDKSRQLQPNGDSDRCSRCGHPAHSQGGRCPVSGKAYLKRKREDHFARMCHSSNIHGVTRDHDPHEDDFELDAVYISELDTILLDSDAIVVSDGFAPWMKALKFCGSLVSFEIDTGAAITVISKPVYHSLKNRPPLMVNKTVPNSSGGRLPFAGSFIGVILKDGEQYKFNVLVVDSTRKNNLREAEVYPASWVMFL